MPQKTGQSRQEKIKKRSLPFLDGLAAHFDPIFI